MHFLHKGVQWATRISSFGTCIAEQYPKKDYLLNCPFFAIAIKQKVHVRMCLILLWMLLVVDLLCPELFTIQAPWVVNKWCQCEGSAAGLLTFKHIKFYGVYAAFIWWGGTEHWAIWESNTLCSHFHQVWQGAQKTLFLPFAQTFYCTFRPTRMLFPMFILIRK